MTQKPPDPDHALIAEFQRHHPGLSVQHNRLLKVENGEVIGWGNYYVWVWRDGMQHPIDASMPTPAEALAVIERRLDEQAR